MCVMRRILLCTVLLLGVEAWAGGWQVANPIQKGRLAIYPVVGTPYATTEKYITLDEGLEAGSIKVGEMGTLVASRMMRTPGAIPAPSRDASRVNELALVNNSDRPLLLLAGEIVSGGKQDRVVSRDRIVP